VTRKRFGDGRGVPAGGGAPCIHDQGRADKLVARSFVTEAANVIMLGPPGVGKTHPAIGLGLKAIEQDHGVFFRLSSKT